MHMIYVAWMILTPLCTTSASRYCHFSNSMGVSVRAGLPITPITNFVAKKCTHIRVVVIGFWHGYNYLSLNCQLLPITITYK